MSNTFSNKLRNGAFSVVLTVSALGAGMFAAPTQAYSIYCSNCSTFYQQLFEYAEAINTTLNTAEQLSTQIQQYDNMVRQGTGLPNSMHNSVTADMQRVAMIYKRSQALGRNISNLDAQFNKKYPGYQSYLNDFANSNGAATDSAMPDRYKTWSENGRANIKTAMEAANMNTGTFEEEDTHLNQLVARSQSAVGRQQAIQAGNEIAAFSVQQLQKLRDLLGTQMQMQGNYMAQEQERAELDDAVRAQRSSGTIRNTAAHKEY